MFIHTDEHEIGRWMLRPEIYYNVKVSHNVQSHHIDPKPPTDLQGIHVILCQPQTHHNILYLVFTIRKKSVPSYTTMS